ncbi:MAG: hypothetical protein JNN26_05145 [Candidatus Obscuribacter sp.]|nr:hypothetical protein [Candidatus Obscuribacter sp.]
MSKIVKRAILISAAISFWCAPQAVLAQSYDTSGLMPTNRDMGYVSRNFGQAENSLGAKGDIDRGSYLTGASPSDYSVYDKRETAFSTKQLYNRDMRLNSPMHPFGLELPLTSTGGLAPIFGFGNQQNPGPQFTSRLDQAITTMVPGGHISVVPSTGQVVSRIGDVRGGLTVGADGISGGSIGNGSFGGTFGGNGGTVGGSIPGLGTFGSGF